MLGNHDIQRSRNFRKKTTVTFANSKKKREGFQHNMHGFRN